jgi:DNA-directed RNA polymerase specialized sigma24 family protein
MVELVERRFAARTNCERDQQELTRLGEVEGFIQLRATEFSMGDPMLAEDLAQEARERALRQLRKHPDCPYSHLINKSRDAIFRYRGKGKSVDGLLYQRGRARQYAIISFEKPIDTEAGHSEETASLREVLSDPAQPRRVTEERAFANVLLDNLREHLSPEENEVLTLRLMGVPWKEVGDRLGQGGRKTAKIQRSIRETAREIWSVTAPEQVGEVLIDSRDSGEAS